MELEYQTAAKNSLFLSASQIFSRLVGFLYFIFLARYLGVERFGIYIFTISFIYNFIPVADFGLERLVLRDISRDESKISLYLKKLIPLRFFLAVFSYLSGLFLGILLGLSAAQVVYLGIFGLALLPYNLTFFILSFQTAKEKMQSLAKFNIYLIVLTAVIGLIFAYFRFSLFWIFLSYPLANLFLTFVLRLEIKKWNLSLGWEIDFRFWKEKILQSWIFAVFTIMAVFYLRTTLIMTGLLKGSEEVGLYGSVFKFVEAVILIPQSLALALFPLSSRLWAKDKEKLKKLYLKALVLLLLISVPFALIFTFFPEMIVMFSYGEKYLPATKVFPVLGLALVLFFANSLSGNVIQNSEKVKKFLPFSVIQLFSALLFSLILIPRFSIIGAAWAVVIGELVGFVLSNWFVFRLLKD